MSKCSKVEPIVKYVLENNLETRSDDFLLVYEVFKHINPNTCNMSFEEVMKNHKELGLPYFESVRRTRPKLQNKYPELLPSKEIQQARALEEAEYKSYALS